MKTFKKTFGGVVFCLIEALIGVVLLINPVKFTSTIIRAFGIVMMVWGIASVIKYFRQEAKDAALGQGLMKGLILIALGGFCALKSGWFLTVFPFIVVIYGIAILISAFSKIQWAIDLLRGKKSKWFLIMISAIISIACSIVILCSPFTSTAVLWMFTAISLIVEAVFDFIALIVNGRNATQQ